MLPFSQSASRLTCRQRRPVRAARGARSAQRARSERETSAERARSAGRCLPRGGSVFAGDGFGGNRVFAARRVGVCWRWLWPLSGFRSCSAAPPSSAQRVCRVEPMFRAGAGASSSGLHTRQTGRPTPRARGGGWGASGLSEGIGGGRGGGSEGPGGALGRAPGDYTHDSRAGRRNARGAGRDACGPGRPTRRGGGRNGWRGGRRQEHRPNGPHGARPYDPDRAPPSP